MEQLYNMEAEQSFLGMILRFNDQIWDCPQLSEKDFAWPVHGLIYKMIYESIIAGKQASAFAIKLELNDNPELIPVGGSNYVIELVTECLNLGKAKDFAEIIKDLSQRRKIVEALEIIKNRVMTESASGAEILTDISKILDDGQTIEIKTKRQVALDAIQSIQIPPDCFKTGIDAIDKAMGGGLYAGFTYGIGGAEKRGKTTLAHTISHNLNSNGILHAYIALEMGSIQIEQRNIAREMGINSLRFLQPESRTNQELIRRGMQVATSTNDSTLYLDMPGATLEQIQVELSRIVLKHDIKGFVLDYWQLIEGQQRGETEERHLRRTAQWIANFARKHKIFCILLSQVNDEGKLFAGKGLVKACDQLYTIELANTGSDEKEIWLRMSHSRYTPLSDVGSELQPVLRINRRSGPFIEQSFSYNL